MWRRLKIQRLKTLWKSTCQKMLLIVRDTKYVDESGHVDYPKYAPDNGFVAGTKHIETLDVGALIDRYGGPGGDFTAPKKVHHIKCGHCPIIKIRMSIMFIE